MFDLMYTPDLLGWVKRSDIEIIYFIELSDLIGIGYDLSDTQDGLIGVGEMGFIFYCDNDSGEQSRAHRPSCCIKSSATHYYHLCFNQPKPHVLARKFTCCYKTAS